MRVGWAAYNTLDEGATRNFDDVVLGDGRQYAPDGGSHPMFIVGVDETGIEITERSNSVIPDSAMMPAPVLNPRGGGMFEVSAFLTSKQ